MSRLDHLYLRIRPDRFHFLKFILEGYDNLAVLSSQKGIPGLVVIRHPRERRRELFTLLASIAVTLA
jgi:hypothetical protein